MDAGWLLVRQLVWNTASATDRNGEWCTVYAAWRDGAIYGSRYRHDQHGGEVRGERDGRGLGSERHDLDSGALYGTSDDAFHAKRYDHCGQHLVISIGHTNGGAAKSCAGGKDRGRYAGGQHAELYGRCTGQRVCPQLRG